MTPAGKAKDDPVDEALEPEEFEAPAVGEAVAYVTVDPNTGAHEEHAALITHAGNGVVDLAVFARHARQARPFQNVPFIKLPEEVPEGTRSFWRYPMVPALPEEVVDE